VTIYTVKFQSLKLWVVSWLMIWINEFNVICTCYLICDLPISALSTHFVVIVFLFLVVLWAVSLRNARNATRELNSSSNFTQATQGLTNHMTSFHLIVTARAPIGLSPLPVQPRWAIQSNFAGLEVVMEWFVVVFIHRTNWIRLFRRAYEQEAKLSLG